MTRTTQRPARGHDARAAAMTAIFVGALALSACADSKAQYPERRIGGKYDPAPTAPEPTIFGPGGILGSDEEDDKGEGGIGVNAFLWRASLDTLSFMPLASADPFGGVIITDWHTSANAPNERFKSTVYILDKRLRADALRVSVFRQTRDSLGGWADAPVANDTATKLENAILGRARELRIADARR